jgi:hypothetical protein
MLSTSGSPIMATTMRRGRFIPLAGPSLLGLFNSRTWSTHAS